VAIESIVKRYRLGLDGQCSSFGSAQNNARPHRSIRIAGNAILRRFVLCLSFAVKESSKCGRATKFRDGNTQRRAADIDTKMSSVDTENCITIRCFVLALSSGA
jgi:hypothetical protein